MENHFDKIARTYNKSWHFSDAYKEWMLDKITHLLTLHASDMFADIGAGTGLYTELITNLIEFNHQPYCVEPSQEMSMIAMKSGNLHVFNEGAHTFTKRLYKYDKVLLKEMIHHVNNRRTLWRNIYKQLNRNGKLLIITRPQSIKMPLFTAAKEAFFNNQPHYDLFVEELIHESFDVDVKTESYIFKLDKNIWFEMLRNRFMSDLATFSDDEIESGIREVEKNIIENEVSIEDKIVFISASK